MKIQEKLYKKYGTGAVILPPPAEEVLNQELTNAPEEDSFELPSEEELSQMSFKSPAVPKIEPISDKEMHRWETWLKSTENLQEYNKGPGRLISDEGQGTIPAVPHPHKSASLDKLVAACDCFEADAILPPTMDGVGDFKLPPSSKPPKIVNPDEELMDALEALRPKKDSYKKKLNEESALLKEIEHSHTIHASVDDILEKCDQYYDRCFID